ncbi:MAG: ATP-binding protein [Angustibacter sp.]
MSSASSNPGLPLDGHKNARALLPADAQCPATARRLVSTLLLAWGCVENIELMELLTSELVSNAVQHAGDWGDIEVELLIDASSIRLFVSDGSAELPMLRPNGTGLGLPMVERLATQWGVEEFILGKRVWLEVDRESSLG